MSVDGRRASWDAVAAAIVLTWAVGVVRMFYGYGSGEHDTFMMAACIVRGAETGQVINGFCYAGQLQFLFYYLSRLITLTGVPSTADVLLVMNVMGAASALAGTLLMLHVLRRVMPERVRADVGLLLLISSPLYYYMLSYGHPFHLGLVLLLVSWVMLLRIIDSSGTGPSALSLYAIGALALQSAALMIRFEQLMLVSLLLIALLWARSLRQIRNPLIATAFLGAAVVVFAICRALLVTGGGQTSTVPASSTSFAGNFRVLLQVFDPALVKWGVAHMTVEVGLPLLALGAAVAVISLLRRRGTALLIGAAGTLPSLFVYLGNPSPPRHLYVLAVGIACMIAAGLDRSIVQRLRGRTAVIAILLVNLATPWGLVLADGKPYPDRANITYNVIQRTDRNQSEIRDSHAFYQDLVSAARKRPIAVFGSWIHMAQIAATVVGDPSIAIGRTTLSGRSAIAFKGDGVELYFIETYDADITRAAIAAIRTARPNLQCLSLVEGMRINDPGLAIPESITWWNA